MSCYQKVEWTIKPKSEPKVIRNCPKCGEKSHYINSNKFRVNANGRNLDVWLIYNCSKCKSKWNLSIHERINPKGIDPEKYERYIKNDKELSQHIGSDPAIHKKNNSELFFDSTEFDIMESKSINDLPTGHLKEITIRCPSSLNLRLDKLLADYMGISRSKLSKTLSDDLPLKKKVKDGMIFIIPYNY